jgi:hypothetical protein
VTRDRRADPALAFLVGLGAFLLYTGGGSIAWPTNTDWLMSGDPAAGWLGWQYFRQTPLLQWPLGANPGYGLELGSSIVFSDSVPLLAFLFKPFSAWLPAYFQYFGLWLALCFGLQALFGWRLARRVIDDRWLALAGAAVFAIAPIACLRLMGHYALVGHWLLLASLDLYLRPDAPRRAWIALLAVASLVHAYLLVMCLAVFGADLLQRLWLRQRGPIASFGLLAIAMALVGLLMWAAGYFMVGGLKGVGISNTDFGLYHMNLLAPIDSDGLWSRWIPDRPGGPGDYEGFAFLGSGMIVLALVAAGVALADRRFGPWRWPTVAPLGGLVVLLLAWAASNHVAFGAREIFSYPVPEVLAPLTSAFRVSGRFAWPVVYLAYIAILWVLARRLSPVAARLLLVGAVGLQLVDGAASWRHFGAQKAEAPAWAPALDSPLWTPLADGRQRLLVVPPRNNPDQWVRLADLAMRHGLGSGALSVARVDARVQAAAEAQRDHELQQGLADAAALYVVQDEGRWLRLLARADAGGFVGDVDGFHVFAPGGCARCDPALLEQARRRALARPLGEGWGFKAREPGTGLLGTGWSVNEDWGTWSDGPAADLSLPLDAGAQGGDIELEIQGSAFLAAGHEAQEVRVAVNGRELARWRYALGDPDDRRRVVVPADLVASGGDRLHVAFRFPDAVSPKAAGVNEDTRVVGLGLVAAKLRRLQP